MCKSSPGGCKEWEAKSLRANGGFHVEGGYTVQQCLDKCIETSQCGMFLINKIPISYSIPSHIPIGSCLLFREGCTIDSSTIADRNAFDFYDLNECSTTTNAKNLKG